MKYLDGLEIADINIIHSQGIAQARNEGAAKAETEILLFLDDDITPPATLQAHIDNLQPGELIIAQERFPSTRVMAIHKSDFWRLGGFDTRLEHVAEDRDFWLKAIDSGFKIKKIPICKVRHFAHPRRCRMKGRVMAREHGLVLRKWLVKQPWYVASHILDRVCHFKLRSILYELFFMVVTR